MSAGPQESGPTDELPPLLSEERNERGMAQRVGLFVAAGVFFVLGVVFWLIPVLTGVPFYVLAVISAGMASQRAARVVNRLERRLPRRLRLLLRRRREPKAGPRGGD